MAYGESITGIKDMCQDPGIIIYFLCSKNRKEPLQKDPGRERGEVILQELAGIGLRMALSALASVLILS